MGGSPGDLSEELCSFSNLYRHFTYVTTHSPTLPSLYLRHSLFSNPFVASPTSQFILQPFFRFSYVTGSSLTSPGEPPMLNTAPSCINPGYPVVWLGESFIHIIICTTEAKPLNLRLLSHTPAFCRRRQRLRHRQRPMGFHTHRHCRNRRTVYFLQRQKIDVSSY